MRGVALCGTSGSGYNCIILVAQSINRNSLAAQFFTAHGAVGNIVIAACILAVGSDIVLNYDFARNMLVHTVGAVTQRIGIVANSAEVCIHGLGEDTAGDGHTGIGEHIAGIPFTGIVLIFGGEGTAGDGGSTAEVVDTAVLAVKFAAADHQSAPVADQIVVVALNGELTAVNGQLAGNTDAIHTLHDELAACDGQIALDDQAIVFVHSGDHQSLAGQIPGFGAGNGILIQQNDDVAFLCCCKGIGQGLKLLIADLGKSIQTGARVGYGVAVTAMAGVGPETVSLESGIGICSLVAVTGCGNSNSLAAQFFTTDSTVDYIVIAAVVDTVRSDIVLNYDFALGVAVRCDLLGVSITAVAGEGLNTLFGAGRLLGHLGGVAVSGSIYISIHIAVTADGTGVGRIALFSTGGGGHLRGIIVIAGGSDLDSRAAHFGFTDGAVDNTLVGTGSAASGFHAVLFHRSGMGMALSGNSFGADSFTAIITSHGNRAGLSTGCIHGSSGGVLVTGCWDGDSLAVGFNTTDGTIGNIVIGAVGIAISSDFILNYDIAMGMAAGIRVGVLVGVAADGTGMRGEALFSTGGGGHDGMIAVVACSGDGHSCAANLFTTYGAVDNTLVGTGSAASGFHAVLFHRSGMGMALSGNSFGADSFTAIITSHGNRAGLSTGCIHGSSGGVLVTGCWDGDSLAVGFNTTDGTIGNIVIGAVGIAISSDFILNYDIAMGMAAGIRVGVLVGVAADRAGVGGVAAGGTGGGGYSGRVIMAIGFTLSFATDGASLGSGAGCIDPIMTRCHDNLCILMATDGTCIGGLTVFRAGRSSLYTRIVFVRTTAPCTIDICISVSSSSI